MKAYSKYKPSGVEWIGEIPEHWEIKKIKYCFEYTTGFTPPTGHNEYYNGDFIWITISDMEGKYIYNSSTKLSYEAISKFNPVITPKNSLLFSFKLSVGKVAFAGTDIYTNEAIISIRPNKKNELKYFYYTLSKQLVKEANENIYGAKLLNQELIKNSLVIVPPKSEQTAIANYLDDKISQLDKLITQKQKLIELLKEERTAIINRAVTHGINPNVKLKPSGIDWLGDIPEHWEVKKLKYIVSKVGSGITPKGGANVYQNYGIPLLRSQNIYNEGLKLEDIAFISEEIDEEMSNSRIEENDILLNITGASIGRCFYVPESFGKGNVNQHVCIIRPLRSKIMTKYLYLILISGYGQTLINFCQNGANREGLNFQQIKSFVIPLPDPKEQERTVYRTDFETKRINETVAKIEKEIQLLQEYRTALISEVVTGKIDVTN